MSVSKDDVAEWKAHPVTQAVFALIKDEIATQSRNLIRSAEQIGTDRLRAQAAGLNAVEQLMSDLEDLEHEQLQ